MGLLNIIYRMHERQKLSIHEIARLTGVFQFDWSENFAVLGGERTKLQMAHIKLSHSRAFLLHA